MFERDAKLYRAASQDNALPDVWGSAYIRALDPMAERENGNPINTQQSQRKTLAAILLEPQVWQAGQFRHLPPPHSWERCFGPNGACPEPGTYQNGAFWATPWPHVAAAAMTAPPELLPTMKGVARKLLDECIADFQANGIWEAVNHELSSYRSVANYTVSATSVLWAYHILEGKRSDS